MNYSKETIYILDIKNIVFERKYIINIYIYYRILKIKKYIHKEFLKLVFRNAIEFIMI